MKIRNRKSGWKRMRNIIFEETILLVIIIMVSFILLSRFGHVDLPGSFNQDKNGSFTLFHEISESWTNILTGAGTLGPAVEPLNETTTNSTAEGNESTTNVTSANESTNILPEEPPSPSESRTLGSQGELGIQTTDVTSCTTLSANGNFTLNSSVSATGTCFDFGGRNITLDCKGFSVTYGTSAAGNAMLIGSGDHNPVVKNCRIVQGASGSSAISVTLAGNFTILNNTINTSTGIGIEVQRREGVIMNNTIRVTGSVQGISLSNPPCGNITIDGNSVNVSGSGTSAFAIETGCAGTNITNNVLSSRFTVVHVSNGDNHNILSNVINMTQTPVTGHEAGILFDTGFAGKSRIAENKIKSTEDGIVITVGTADNGVFSHNMIDCRFQCIEISAGGATGPQDNIFVNNNITATEGQEISDASTSTVNYLIYNNSLGEIKWLNNGTGSFLLDLSININNDQGIGLGKNLFIGNNTAALNSSAFSTGKMNFSQANVTLRGLGIPSVTAVMRLANFTTVEADIINKGSNCNGTTCRIVSYDNTIGTLIFNTTRFSSFAANRTLGAAADTVPPSVVIVNPANGSNLSNGLQAFNATVTDSASAVETVRFSFSNASGIPFNVTATNLSGNWNANVNITTLAEGPHTMTVFANDTAGNVNDTVFIQFTVDRTPPRVTIDQPLSGRNYTVFFGNETFNVTVRDTNLSVQYVLFSFDNFTGTGFNVTAVNGSGNWAASVNVSGLAEGPHTMTVFANDTNGNLNNTEFITFVVDNTPPRVTITTPANGSVLDGGTRSFNATIHDTNLSIYAVIFSYNNGTGIPFNVTATNVSGTWTTNLDLSRLTEGLNRMTVFANDTNGNLNNTEFLEFTIDRTAPAVTIVNPANGSNLSFNFQAFNATVTNGGAAVETVLFSFDNFSSPGFNVTATNNSGNWNANVNITTLAEGPHTMTVFANDTAGNVNDTVFIQFTVDRTPPRVVINVPANGTNVSDRITDLLVFNTPIRDTNLSIYAVIFRFDNATGNDFNVTAVNVSGNWSTTLNLSRLVDGFHAMTVSANDTNGNLNSTEFVEFTVDRTAPTVIFLNPSNESNLSGGLQAFNATVIDSLTQVNVVLFQFTNGTRPFNVTAANRSGNWNANVNISTIVEGLTTITVFANDTLNNVNNTQTINIHVDLAAPNVNIVNSSFSTTSTTPSITFNFTDNVSLSANCSLYLNNIFNVSNAATPNNTNTILTASTLNIASYEATVNCTDGSGNTGNSTAITITITAVPEEIGAPPAAPSGGGGVKVAPVVECKTDADCPVDKYCVAGFCEKIFDLKILSLDSPIEPGEFLDFTYYVKAMANISGDVTFDFFVKKADETFSSGSDVIFMGDREEKIESAQVFLPTTLADGTYIFSIQLHFGRYEVNSHRTFEVKHEVPLLPTLTLLDLFPVKSGIAWNYSAILSVNKDVLVPVTFERSITKEGAQVWFKKEKITLNRTLVVVDQVDGLEEGTYILHAVMYAADENASAERTFSITKEGALQLPEEGKHLPQLQKEKKALFGAAIAGKAISTARSYWLPLLLLLLIALGTVVVLVVTKKKMRTGKVVQELDIDKLELWMGKATAASMSRENMMMAANKAGWSTEQVRTALARIEAIQKFHQAYGKALPEKTVQAFKAFVAMQARMGIDKKEVINKLVRQGWKKESIERFVEAYY